MFDADAIVAAAVPASAEPAVAERKFGAAVWTTEVPHAPIVGPDTVITVGFVAPVTEITT